MKQYIWNVLAILMLGTLVILLIFPDCLRAALPQGLMVTIQKGRSTVIYATLLGISAIIGIVVVYLIEHFKNKKGKK